MTTQGIFLLAYGFFIVGTVDNVFRFWLQDKIGNTHPLITNFGVIIGLEFVWFYRFDIWAYFDFTVHFTNKNIW